MYTTQTFDLAQAIVRNRAHNHLALEELVNAVSEVFRFTMHGGTYANEDFDVTSRLASAFYKATLDKNGNSVLYRA